MLCSEPSCICLCVVCAQSLKKSPKTAEDLQCTGSCDCAVCLFPLSLLACQPVQMHGSRRLAEGLLCSVEKWLKRVFVVACSARPRNITWRNRLLPACRESFLASARPVLSGFVRFLRSSASSVRLLPSTWDDRFSCCPEARRHRCVKPLLPACPAVVELFHLHWAYNFSYGAILWGCYGNGCLFQT